MIILCKHNKWQKHKESSLEVLCMCTASSQVCLRFLWMVVSLTIPFQELTALPRVLFMVTFSPHSPGPQLKRPLLGCDERYPWQVPDIRETPSFNMKCAVSSKLYWNSLYQIMGVLLCSCCERAHEDWMLDVVLFFSCIYWDIIRFFLNLLI